MVELSTTTKLQESIDQLFYDDWASKLATHDIFTDANNLVTSDNIPQLLKALELENILKTKECVQLLDFYDRKQAPYHLYYRDLVKLLDHVADSDYQLILGSYSTPAERIVKMLLVIKHTYLAEGQTPDLEKEVNYAINTINERTIYQSSNRDSPLPKLSNNKKSVIVESWLNEYSDSSVESSS